MPDNTEAQSTEYAPWPSAGVKRLDALAGAWSIEIYLPSVPPKVVSGQANFEWLGEGYFLVERSEMAAPEFPKTVAIIGCDGAMDTYSMLYYDSRGVSRLYQMTLNDEEWNLWRNDPEFFQRFVGRFSDNGNTIKGYWEKSSDGENWDLDFDQIYTKVEQTTII